MNTLKFGLIAGGLGALAIAAVPALNMTVALDESTVTAITTDTDWDPNSMTVYQDGSLFFIFEDESGPAADLTDSIVQSDGVTYSLFCSNEAIAAALGISTTLQIEDMVTDFADNIYALVIDGATGYSHIARIDSSANVTRLAASIEVDGCVAIDIDEDASPERLVLYIENLFASGNNGGGLWAIDNPSTASDAVPTAIAGDFIIATNGLSPSNVASEVGFSDIAVDPNTGDIYGFNTWGFNAGDHDIVRVDKFGNPFLWADQADLLTAFGASSGTIASHDLLLEVEPNGTVLIFNGGTGVPTSPEEGCIRSGDGTTFTTVFTQADVITALGSGSDITSSGNGFAMTNAGELYFNTVSDVEGVLRVTGPEVPVELSVFSAE